MCQRAQGGELHASCDAAAVSPNSVRMNTFRLARAAPAAGGSCVGPCLCDFQARSLGSGGHGGRTAVSGHVVAAEAATFSKADSSGYAASTWLYETQWHAAASATEAAARRSIADGVSLRKTRALPQWTISTRSGLQAVGQTPGRYDSSSASAVAATAELMRVLQQQSPTAVLEPVTIQTVAAFAATPSLTAYSDRGPAKAAAQAGAALGGALRTAVLEGSRLRAALYDAAGEGCAAWREAMNQQEQAAAASRAGAIHLRK